MAHGQKLALDLDVPRCAEGAADLPTAVPVWLHLVRAVLVMIDQELDHGQFLVRLQCPRSKLCHGSHDGPQGLPGLRDLQDCQECLGPRARRDQGAP